MKKKSKNYSVFIRDSNPFNLSIAEWTVLWWKWLHSIPKDRNPASDANGEYGSTSQNNPNVWFLAGTFGGSATRKCSIPSGKAILFPIITCIFSFLNNPQLKYEQELIGGVTKDLNTLKQLSLTVDKVTYRKLNRFRVTSEPFEDVINGTKTKAVSDGYWVFMNPLDIGNHIVHFVGSNIDFYNEVTYYISIISN